MQAAPVGCVAEDVRGGGEVEGAEVGQAGGVGDEVLDVAAVLRRLVLAGQPDHLLGDVDADGPPGPAAGEQPGVVAVSAGQVEGVEAAQSAERVEGPVQGVGVGRGVGRRARGLRVALADGVVLEPHALPSAGLPGGCGTRAYRAPWRARVAARTPVRPRTSP